MRQLLKYFIKGKQSIDYSIWFTQNFDTSDFIGLDQAVYHYVKFCADLGIECSQKYIDSFVKTDAKSIIFKYNIKMTEMGNYNYDDPTALEEGLRVITNSLVAVYNEAARQSEIEDYNQGDFKADIKVWMAEQQKLLMQESINNVVAHFHSGLTVEKLMDDMQYDLDKIRTVFNARKLDKIDFLSTSSSGLTGSPLNSTLIGNTQIPCVGDIFAGLLYTITAPAGAGKTRLLVRILYNLMVYDKVNSLFFSLEMPKFKVENMLISIHVSVRFNITMPDTVANKGLLTKEQKKYYEAAKADLFNNPNSGYGKIYIVADKTPVETLYKEVVSILRRDSTIKVFGVDYVGLFTSKPINPRTPPTQRSFIPQEAYDVIHDIVVDTGVACIALNQYTGSGSDKAKNGEDIVEGDIQGGPAINRYTDFNVYINQTKEQLAGGYFQMTSDKVREGKGFYRVLFRVVYPISKFVQQQSGGGS